MHLTLYDTVDYIVDPLPLEDLPIVGHSDEKAKAMMHGDEGIEDIRPFLLSKSRQPKATLAAIPTFYASHLETVLDCTIHTI